MNTEKAAAAPFELFGGPFDGTMVDVPGSEPIVRMISEADRTAIYVWDVNKLRYQFHSWRSTKSGKPL